MATAIDRDKKQVVLAGGQRIPYDRLVVAPGIDIKFDSVPGYSEAAAQQMPHAWKPGAWRWPLRTAAQFRCEHDWYGLPVEKLIVDFVRPPQQVS